MEIGNGLGRYSLSGPSILCDVELFRGLPSHVVRIEHFQRLRTAPIDDRVHVTIHTIFEVSIRSVL
jgi:hypothetical protein